MGSEVKFDAQGDGLARYTITNYRRLGGSSNNGYDYKVLLHLTKSRNAANAVVYLAIDFHLFSFFFY